MIVLPPGSGARRALLAAALCAVASFGAFASEGGGEKKAEGEGAPVGPPPPRLVAPLPIPPLPPDPTDPSWLRYREGLALFDEKRFGEALDAFKKAIEAREARSAEALEAIDEALADKEASKAKGSTRALVELLASRDLVASELERVRAEAGGSLLKEMSLLRARRVSGLLDAFLRAARLVVDQRGGTRVGDSLASLRDAAASMRYYPEAEYALGRIFLAEGEVALAEIQFRRALDSSESLDVPADRYAMLEALAETYRASGKARDYELALREIADDSSLFQKKQEALRLAMERTLARDGIEKFMLLYRVEDRFARSSFSRLGRYYLESGRPLATIYLAAAVDAGLTEAIATLRAKEPGYSYTSVVDLLASIAADRALSRHAASGGLYEDMLLLGEALAMGGAGEPARGIWRLLASPRAPSPWGAEAAIALARPAGARGPYPKTVPR